MNGNHEFNRMYADQRIRERLREAEAERLAKLAATVPGESASQERPAAKHWSLRLPRPWFLLRWARLGN